MNPPSDKDCWNIASSLASSIGDEGGFPNAKFLFSSAAAPPMADGDGVAVADEEEEEDTSSLPRRFADHTYRDFSSFIKDGGKILRHKKSESNFPARLHAMLSNEEYSHIISWMVSYTFGVCRGEMIASEKY